jgi:hypothetical protein
MQLQENDSTPLILRMQDLAKDNHHNDQCLNPCGEDLDEKTHQEEEERTLLEESFVPLLAEMEETHQEVIPQEEAHQEEIQTTMTQMTQTTPIQKSLGGKEPTILTGDRDKAESFFLEWRIDQLLNHDVDTIKVPFTRAMLFLSYIKGDRVHEWAAMQVQWLGQRIANGADPNDEYLMDTRENSFETAFRDTMSEQKAMGDFDTLVMEKGNLDEYIN